MLVKDQIRMQMDRMGVSPRELAKRIGASEQTGTLELGVFASSRTWRPARCGSSTKDFSQPGKLSVA